jgi:hypothetical protein
MSSIAIVGESGTGKSSSYGQIPEIGIEGLNPKETVVINVTQDKDLPFRGWKKSYSGKLSEGGNYVQTSDASQIAAAIKYISDNRPDIQNIVVDDSQYIMSFEFMNRAKENGYGKFSDLGVNISKVLAAARNTRPDLKCYFLWHPEKDNLGAMKMKTVGTMVDSYLTLEGLFTVILYSKVSKSADNKIQYNFVTNNDGQYPAKSPVGMFKDLYISNDLGLVSKTIDEFNNG